MDVDLLEGDIIHEFQPHHHHAGDPEEDDIEAGDQYAGGVEGLQLGGLLWPAQSREGPERGGEPSVEYILILSQY